MDSLPAPTPLSRDLWQFDPLTRGLVLGLCLSDEDLTPLVDCPDAEFCFSRSPDSLRRDRLQAGCRRNSRVCARVSDLLDLRHVDTVQFVRSADPEAVSETVDSCLRVGLHARLPALLWATATDPRPEIQELSHFIARETMARACDLIREVIAFSETPED